MKRLKFEMWIHRPEVGGIMSRFTDGRGISTESWWSSPMQSIDHVGPEYLKNPHRHPNVRNGSHEAFIKRRYKEEMKRFKHDPDGWRKYEEVSQTNLDKERYKRMEAALRNILETSSDPFSISQARYGLEVKRNETNG